ncbi:MAG: sulfatase-like hydrolase/transferase [Thermoanaerobaculia bacterium]|nr:sulfatase-like hydrolase/transferase [Thermoanaerobaculia bacterium]
MKSPRSLSVLLGLVVAGAGVQCGGLARTAEFPDAPVILISIDTLRSDHLPMYGYAGGSTPHLDAFRRDAILFERAYSHYPLTLPSHCSVLTGQLPSEHGVRDNTGYVLASDVPYLPQLLQDRGYRTAAAVSAGPLGASKGLARGFDVYDDDFEAAGRWPGRWVRPGPETFAQALAWLRTQGDRPFFLFTHIFEPHQPFDVPAGRRATRYDDDITAADAAVGHFLAELKARDLYDRSLIVLFSDHGEGLGDHVEEEHGLLLYREVLAVPLVLKLPGQRLAGTAVGAVAQLIDITPTVLSAIGAPVAKELRGTSLLDLTRPGSPDRAVYAETFYPRLYAGWSELTAVIVDGHHYIEGAHGELYDLAADPAQKNDLVSRDRRRVAALRETLRSFWTPLVAPSELSRVPEALAALGYLSTPRRDIGGDRPDPRRRLAAIAQLQKARALDAAGQDKAAAHQFEELLAGEPNLPDAWSAYAEILVRLDRREAAIAAYRKAIESSGFVPHLIARLSMLVLEAGRPEEALAILETSAKAGESPEVIVRQMAVVLTARGRFEEAISTLAPLVVRGDLESRWLLAQAYDRAGRHEEARTALGAVLAVAPNHERALALLTELERRPL